jgi:hypothetical protein
MVSAAVVDWCSLLPGWYVLRVGADGRVLVVLVAGVGGSRRWLS